MKQRGVLNIRHTEYSKPIKAQELFLYTFVLHGYVCACVEVCCIVLHLARGNAR